MVATGETVCDRLDDATEAAVSGDDDLARSVVESDPEVDETYLTSTDERAELPALRRPVAADLRLVAAPAEAGTDLERVADLAAYGGPEGGVRPAVDLRRVARRAGPRRAGGPSDART